MKPVYKIVCMHHEHLPDRFFLYGGYFYSSGFRYNLNPVVSTEDMEKLRAFCLRNEMTAVLDYPVEYADVTYGSYCPNEGVTRFII